MLIARAEVEGRGPLDVRLAGGRVAAIAPRLAARSREPVLDAAGGALLPGLHDHHIHLLALAAARASVACGPPAVRSEADLAGALARARPARGWLRGVGYHESVAGALDRARLDRIAPRPRVRIQHRSGALWVVNSAGARALGLDEATHPGVERDARGRATGRLFRADAWLGRRLGPGPAPELAPVGRCLARFGLTGLTDASASNGPDAARILGAARERGELPQRLLLMGGPDLPEAPGLARGALKILLDERALPGLEALRERVAAAHAEGRPVAIHCVTRAELWLALAALEAAGARAGDRVEHAAVAPPEAASALARLGVAVVTQPHFLSERGDAYARDVAPEDRPWLYRGRGLDEAGVALGGGSDAPFGHPDPWRAMRAAVERRSEGGVVFDAGEALGPERALALFTTPPEAPGGPPRRVGPGAAADLCLLDRPWAKAREALSSEAVVATWVEGALVWQAP